jgi:hypothetical protein
MSRNSLVIVTIEDRLERKARIANWRLVFGVWWKIPFAHNKKAPTR